MLTIDWKERLNMDTADFLKNKLPKGDYDFEIIFIAYPERVNGKIPAEVISQVANNIVQQLGKNMSCIFLSIMHCGRRREIMASRHLLRFLASFYIESLQCICLFWKERFQQLTGQR